MQAFLSYEYTRNQEYVDELAAELRKREITPFTNDLQLALGDKLIEQLDKALRDCDFAIAVLTKEYVESDWLQKELFALYMKEKLMKTDYLLPILVEDCEVPRYIDKEKICDLKGVPTAQVYDRIRPLIAKTRQVFVIMKFGDEELDSTYQLAIKPVIEKFNYNPMRIDQIEKSEPITPRILTEIRRSAVVLADLTGRRPNCYYETGFAHALDKEIILTVKDGEEIDFDLKVHKFIIWTTPKDLQEALDRRFESIQTDRPRGAV
jgi:hypothetical protein